MTVAPTISASGSSPAQAPTQAASAANPAQNGGDANIFDTLLALLGQITAELEGAAPPSAGTNASTDAGANIAGADASAGTQGSGKTGDAAKTPHGLIADISSMFGANAPEDAGANADVLAQLQANFQALAAKGPLDDTALAGFRDQAIALMKTDGFDNNQIDKTLTQLTADLGSQLSGQQAALLAMPVLPLPLPFVPPPPSAASADNLTVTGNAGAGGQAGSAPDTGSGSPAGTNQNTDANAASSQTPASGDTTQANSGKTDVAVPHPQLHINDTQRDSAAGVDAAQQQGGWKNPAPLPAQAPGPQASGGDAAWNTPGASAGAGAQGGSGNSFSNEGQSGGQDASSQQSASPGAGPGGVSLAAAAPGTQNFVNFVSQAQAGASPTTQFVALNIRRNAAAGTDTFTLQLDPAELGRLEVRLKFDKTGSVTAHLTADKPETLALLQKDAPQLAKLLQQSGFSTGDQSLSFDLRQQGQQGGYAGTQTGSGAIDASAGGTGNISLQAQLPVETGGTITRSGVNIMV